MAYSYTNTQGKVYTLHYRLITNPSGEVGKFYYFADAEGIDALDELPEGYQISEEEDGHPILQHIQD